MISGVVLESAKLRCGFVICLMSMYWMLELMPLAVTALLPLFLFPVLNIAKGVEVSTQYFEDIIVLVMGGLIVAIAIEEWDVHKRIALGWWKNRALFSIGCSRETKFEILQNYAVFHI